jgi:hypothetical protein
MNELKKIFETKRTEMDLFEPDDGHLMRFRNKLDSESSVRYRFYPAIAAVLITGIIISGSLLLSQNGKSDVLPTELREAAWFYDNRSEVLLSEIRGNMQMNETDKKMILKDIREFDKEYLNILKDLRKYPGDERLINAFIDYHRSRTEFLQGIVNQVNVNSKNII